MKGLTKAQKRTLAMLERGAVIRLGVNTWHIDGRRVSRTIIHKLINRGFAVHVGDIIQLKEIDHARE